MAERVNDLSGGAKSGNNTSDKTGRRRGETDDEPTAEAVLGLSGFAIFSQLPENSIKATEALCARRVFPPGAKIIERGQTGDDIYFLVSGVAQVLNFADSGRAVAFAQLHGGDYFGELAAIDNKPRSATVVAQTVCVLAVMPGPEFVRLMSSFPTIALAILRKLANVVRTSDERIVDLSVLGAEQRICVELLKLAKPNPISPHAEFEIFPVPTQKFLAREIGVTRETVARIFSHLKGEGIIRRESNVLYICDRQRLEQTILSNKAPKLSN